MSTRLQVVMGDKEMEHIRQIAERERLTVSQWVRQTLRDAQKEYPTSDVDRKIQIVREAVSHSFPAGDIREMLREIERGATGQGDK